MGFHLTDNLDPAASEREKRLGNEPVICVKTRETMGMLSLLLSSIALHQLGDVTEEVLQLWRRNLITWLDAPARCFGFGSFQVAAIRTGGHLAGGWLVSAFLSVLPRRGRTRCRTRTFRRSRHRLEVGAALKGRGGLRAVGVLYTEPSTPAVRRSTSFCRLNATQLRLSAFSPRPWAERTIRRRGSSTPTGTPVIHRP